MAAHQPFDPGIPNTSIDPTAEKQVDLPPNGPRPSQSGNSHHARSLDTSPYLANSAPNPYNPCLGDAPSQPGQWAWAPEQFAGPPSYSPYYLHLGPYHHLPYHLSETLMYGAQAYGMSVHQHQAAMPGLQNGIVSDDFPYLSSTRGYGTLDRQGLRSNPFRNDFGHRESRSGLCKITPDPQPRVSARKSRKENVIPQQNSISRNGVSTITPGAQEVLSASKSPSRPAVPAAAPAPATTQQHHLCPMLTTPFPPAQEAHSPAHDENAARPQSWPREPPAPRARTVLDGQATSSAAQPAIQSRWMPENYQAIPQGRLIANLAKLNSVSSYSALEVFSEEQCDKILWLALHGIPGRAIGWLVSDIQKPATVDKKTFAANLGKVAQQFVPELARGHHGEDEPDELIQHLLNQGDSLYWSPFLLKHAIDYTFISDDAGDGAEQERRNNARERKALPKWNHRHGGDPVAGAFRAQFKGRNTKAMVAFGGLIRNASEQDIIEDHFGYREGSHEVEKVLMKRWLLKIRELGQLPDRLEDGEVQVDGNGRVEAMLDLTA